MEFFTHCFGQRITQGCNFIQNEENFSEEDFYTLSSENEIEKSDQNTELEQTYLMSDSSVVNYNQNGENNLNELTEIFPHNEENDSKDDDWKLFHGDFFTSY